MPWHRRLRTALVAFRATLTGPAVFDSVAPEEPWTELQWATLLILHLEAQHDCHHTDLAREELGIVGPRGKAAI